MTYRALRLRLLAVSCVLFIALAASLAEYLPRFWPNLNLFRLFPVLSSMLAPAVAPVSSNGTFVSQNAALIALIAGAYSAYCLQQRGKFIDELRDWWNDMVQAKSEFLIYCDCDEPTEDGYLKAFYKLSTAMDTLRLIYCNVDRTRRNPKGYYPFEQVRDIIDMARSVRPRRESSSPKLILPSCMARAQVKRAIDIIFQSLRHAIQAEAKASPPDHPTRFDSVYRGKYIEDLKKTNIDLVSIRRQNQREAQHPV
jgi:hypothetical protein